MADEQKTERATPHRREKARERGQVVRSRELPAAFTLLGVAVMFHWIEGGMLAEWHGLFRNLLGAATHADFANAPLIILWTARTTLHWAAPPLALAFVVSAGFLLAQSGLVLAPEALQPDLERFNPVKNISRIFSVAGLSPMLKSFLPAAALIYLAVAIVSREWAMAVHSTGMSLPMDLHWLSGILYEFAWKGGLILIVWAGIDYGLQKWNYERSLRMSRQELKDEYKNLEGNPATRMRIRRRRREMRSRNMLRQVRRATVVITNPDHFAVALEYVPEKMAAPLVLAKGRNETAEKIKREARWHEVPIVENPPLAQALYRTVEIGGSIPAKLYTAVAEVLAFIYRAQQRMRTEAAARSAAAAGPVPGGTSGNSAGEKKNS
ncbi:MAG: EscU/YscU/HrcU family type III secretion system export apparatus switch protein [Candidatus Acidiferrales bacterium]